MSTFFSGTFHNMHCKMTHMEVSVNGKLHFSLKDGMVLSKYHDLLHTDQTLYGYCSA